MTAGWLGASHIELVSRYWPNATDLEADELDAVLTSAAIQCDAYAPDADVIPDNYVHAQVLQARALWRASIAGRDDQIGMDGMTVTVFPMDWTVKALLRPKRGPWVR